MLALRIRPWVCDEDALVWDEKGSAKLNREFLSHFGTAAVSNLVFFKKAQAFALISSDIT